jgi:hypothetical protein
MGVIGSLTARMVLETGEYMAAAEKVVRRTDSMGSQISRTLGKASATYGKALTKGAIGLLGAMGVDQVLDDLNKKMMTEGFKNGTDVVRTLGSSILDLSKGIPIIGGLVTAIDFAVTDTERWKQKNIELQQEIRKTVDAYKNMSGAGDSALMSMSISDFMNSSDSDKQSIRDADEFRTKVAALRAEYEKIIANIETVNGLYDFQRKQLKAEALTAFVNQEGALRKQLELNEAKRKQAEIEAEVNAIMAEQAELDEVSEMVQQDINERERGRADFMRDLQRSYESSLLSERELFQKKLDSLGIMGEQAAKAWELHDAMEAQKQTADATQRLQSMMGFSNVESLNTAIGGVKVSGMSSFSLERMMPTQEAIRRAVEEMAKNSRTPGAP